VRKVRRIVLGIFCAVVMLFVLGSCMRMVRISPPGLFETIQNFELLDISVRSITYFPPEMNNLRIDIEIHNEIIPNEYITLLMDALHEYFKSQQFTDFVNTGVHGIEFDYLHVSVHIFGTEEGHIIRGIREFAY